MSVMSQTGFEKALGRAGMQIRRGNLTEVPWSTGAEGEFVANVAWAGRDMSVFAIDWADSRTVELETLARKDVVVCTAVLNPDGVHTDYAIGDSRFDAQGADMSVIFVPQHERFECVASVTRGFKAVSVIVDIMNMIESRGLPAATLPKSLLRTIQRREVAMDTIVPGHFGAIARDVAARRAVFPSLATLYYEGKTLELVSALLSGLSRRDAFRAGDGAFDPRILDRLDLVKQIIDRAPHRALDIDVLARVAAMNRTKLRSAFKQVYGTTLSAYRTTLMLQRADRAIKEAGASVKQAAHHAGYATTSSFIIAYKRQYGVCPGIVLRD
jgi:AraC-like DNA-binding protein